MTLLRAPQLPSSAQLRTTQQMAQAHGWTNPIRRKTETINWLTSTPFLLLQSTPLLVLWVGWSWTAVGVAAVMYVLRMFAVTGFYHRYFSHRAFRTSRFMQFIFAVLGNSSGQKGPLWWAAHHRYHHQNADQDTDLHSPAQHGILWSHVGWLLSDLSKPTNHGRVKDLSQFPELRFLDRHYHIVPLLLLAAMFGLGTALAAWVPESQTNGSQMAVWGFFVSTVTLFHATYTINSLAHRFGSRRFATQDHSRNNFWLALITFGEGWHNNHHKFPRAARQGLKWWEIDFTWYGLWLLEKLGVIWDVRSAPKASSAFSS